MKHALVTGAAGQDGSYLVELLLDKGYNVCAVVQESKRDKLHNLDGVINCDRVRIVYDDLLSSSNTQKLVDAVAPDEVYNLAARSHVVQSYDHPIETFNVSAGITVNILEAIKRSNAKTKFYQAGSSEMFGKPIYSPQDTECPFKPRNPYGSSKTFAHNIVQNYRDAYGIYAVNGILYNHESPRRDERFVTRKITRAVGRIFAGTQTKLVLGSVDAQRDWGYAPEYVDAMWRMLQSNLPRDYVIGTGKLHTVKDFLEFSFKEVGLNWQNYVEISDAFKRQPESVQLVANTYQAKSQLQWETKITLKEIVAMMVKSDITLAENERRMSVIDQLQSGGTT